MRRICFWYYLSAADVLPILIYSMTGRVMPYHVLNSIGFGFNGSLCVGSISSKWQDAMV
jgi:hypothetical protein